MKDLINKTGEELYEYYITEDTSIVHDFIFDLSMIMDRSSLHSFLIDNVKEYKKLKVVYPMFNEKPSKNDVYLGPVYDGNLYITSSK